MHTPRACRGRKIPPNKIWRVKIAARPPLRRFLPPRSCSVALFVPNKLGGVLFIRPRTNMSRQPHRQTYFDVLEKTDSSRPTYRPARQGEKTNRQDRRCTTTHLDGLSQTPCEMLVGPWELISCEACDLDWADHVAESLSGWARVQSWSLSL